MKRLAFFSIALFAQLFFPAKMMYPINCWSQRCIQRLPARRQANQPEVLP